MRLVHWRKTMLFRLFALGMKLQLFGFRWQNFNFQITFLIILFSPATSYPKKEGKTILPILYRRLSRKNKKGNPLFADAHRGSQKRKRYVFLLVWSAKFGGYDIEYPLFWQKNQSKITENFCGNPRSSAERVPQGKITGKNSRKKKREVQGFLLPQIFGSLTGVAGSDLETLAGAAAPANGEWELLGTNRIIKNTVGTFLLLYFPNYNKAKILFPAVLDGVAAFLETFK